MNGWKAKKKSFQPNIVTDRFEKGRKREKKSFFNFMPERMPDIRSGGKGIKNTQIRRVRLNIPHTNVFKNREKAV